jgi:hypothetical protein
MMQLSAVEHADLANLAVHLLCAPVRSYYSRFDE